MKARLSKEQQYMLLVASPKMYVSKASPKAMSAATGLEYHGYIVLEDNSSPTHLCYTLTQKGAACRPDR
jgi:hypothetical protein